VPCCIVPTRPIVSHLESLFNCRLANAGGYPTDRTGADQPSSSSGQPVHSTGSPGAGASAIPPTWIAPPTLSPKASWGGTGPCCSQAWSLVQAARRLHLRGEHGRLAVLEADLQLTPVAGAAPQGVQHGPGRVQRRVDDHSSPNHAL
jgi:hypothetical protein